MAPTVTLTSIFSGLTLNHEKQIKQLRDQLQQSNETFVIHYQQTYSEPELPPIWAMTELISLGTLRAWIAATELDSKTKVARSLGTPSAQVLNGVLHSLNLLRNISAHHGRLWNRLIVKRLPKIKKLQHLLVLEDVDGEGVQPSKNLYNYLVVMATSCARLRLSAPGHRAWRKSFHPCQASSKKPWAALWAGNSNRSGADRSRLRP